MCVCVNKVTRHSRGGVKKNWIWSQYKSVMMCENLEFGPQQCKAQCTEYIIGTNKIVINIHILIYIFVIFSEKLILFSKVALHYKKLFKRLLHC